MRIHLLRHAEAEAGTGSDFDRRLTDLGQSQAKQVGRYLRRIGQSFDRIITSPYPRASLTAHLVAAELGGIPLLEDRRLGCGLEPETGWKLLLENQNCADLLLVGHQPDLGLLAARLLTRDSSLEIDFEKASLLSLTIWPLSQTAGVLDAYINVRQM